MYTVNSLGLELTGQSVKERKMVSLFSFTFKNLKKKKTNQDLFFNTHYMGTGQDRKGPCPCAAGETDNN